MSVRVRVSPPLMDAPHLELLDRDPVVQKVVMEAMVQWWGADDQFGAQGHVQAAVLGGVVVKNTQQGQELPAEQEERAQGLGGGKQEENTFSMAYYLLLKKKDGGDAGTCTSVWELWVCWFQLMGSWKSGSSICGEQFS